MAFNIKTPYEVATHVKKKAGTTHIVSKSKAAGIGLNSTTGFLAYHDGTAVRNVMSQTGAGMLSSETKFCTTQFDAVTGTTGVTLTDIVGLTGFVLVAAGVYKYEVFLNGVATANCGHKIGFKYTTATLTSLNNGTQALLAASMAYTQSTTATDQASLHAATTVTLGIVLRGRIVVNAGGTLAVQAAQNAAHADTTSVFVGSWATFTRIS